MINWKLQNAALIGEVRLSTGGQGAVILVDGAQNPAGAVLVVPSPGGEKQTLQFPEATGWISADTYLDVLAAQERHFGGGTLPRLEV